MVVMTASPSGSPHSRGRTRCDAHHRMLTLGLLYLQRDPFQVLTDVRRSRASAHADSSVCHVPGDGHNPETFLLHFHAERPQW